ncbi:MAG: arabinan endo-1,5-alpha-L-arabinosidase [Chthoniobacteraceae bacterium]
MLLATCLGVALLATMQGRQPPRFGSRIIHVHDPSTIIRGGDEYWLYATGQGIRVWHSPDLVHWERSGPVFKTPPTWTHEAAPDFRGYVWAPDVIHVGGRYLLYYSVSRWGTKESSIGLFSNATLDPADPHFQWRDEGEIIRTTPKSDFNAIDPSLLALSNGQLWMAFGSFWTGIKLVQLDPVTGHRLDSSISSLAWHPEIEAACIYEHDGWYYLFMNWGLCCRGVKSTYEIRMGRSRSITGPYLDQTGRDLRYDGGTLFLGSEEKFIGPGHAAILHDGGKYWFSCHFYDGENWGSSTLAIRPLTWSSDGWPVLEKGS